MLLMCVFYYQQRELKFYLSDLQYKISGMHECGDITENESENETDRERNRETERREPKMDNIELPF